MDGIEPTARQVRSIRGSGLHADVTIGTTPNPVAANGGVDGAEDERSSRERAAVCAAILALLADRIPVTIDAVSARSGVAVRTIFRRFGDLDAAVAHAQDERLAAVYEMWEAQTPPNPHLSLDERVEIILDQRFELERFGRPMRFTRQEPNPDMEFDADVIETFAPELERMSDERRQRVGLAVAFVLRPRTIRIHLDSQGDETLARETIRATLLEALKD